MLLFALTDHLGFTISSLSAVEILLVVFRASGISTGVVPGNLLRDIPWFGLHPCISVHSGGKKPGLSGASLFNQPGITQASNSADLHSFWPEDIEQAQQGRSGDLETSSDGSHGALAPLLSLWSWERQHTSKLTTLSAKLPCWCCSPR